MEDISDFVKLYIESSDILEDTVKDIEHNLLPAIQKNLYKGHGYDTGTLYSDIATTSSTHGSIGVITAYYTVEHGQYWYRWKNWKEDEGFLDLGVNKILELYK